MIIASPALAIPQSNIDTDQIIPAHQLTRLDDTGMGEFLFDGMTGGKAYLARVPDAQILITGENFGCGSSREHAAWALRDRGIKAIISPSFARIFHENAYTNGIVPIVLPHDTVAALFDAVNISIDVTGETLSADGGAPIAFELDALRKQFILGGGFLGYLAKKIPTVRAWEAAR